jgi:hypothetical protein
MIHGNGESREAHVGSQSADTIKLNFINLILESISVRAALTNRRTDKFSNDSRGVFEDLARIVLQTVWATDVPG